MKKAVILHTIDDAENCIKNGFHRDRFLFSTYPGVDIYLKENHGVSSSCLSLFFDREEIIRMRNSSVATTDSVLQFLEQTISPALNAQTGLSIRYFVPLYSYIAKFHCLGLAILAEGIEKIVQQYGLNEISIYSYPLDAFLLGGGIETIFPLLNNNFRKEIIPSNGKKDDSEFLRIKGKIGQLKRRVKKNMRFFRNKFLFKTENMREKTILLSEPLYDLNFLREQLIGPNIVCYSSESDYPERCLIRENTTGINVALGVSRDIRGMPDQLSGILCNHILSDFGAKINRYVRSISFLKSLNRKHPICLGIWGNSPIEGLRALVFEYLRSEKICIIGGQHGASYGNQYEPWHFDSDFNRCNYFLSYGFTGEDLARTYPGKQIRAQIVPVGTTKEIEQHTAKKKIDILFPITNSMSIFNGGMARISPHELVERQVHLLEYLDSLNNYNVYVKPFIGSTWQNCAVISFLKKLKNAHVVYGISLPDFLNRFEPRAVIIEYPSTPLYEVLGIDTEIFLMDDWMHPFENAALQQLERRVHYSDHIDNIIRNISLFLEDKLEKKRDDTFYRHHVYKEHARENIIDVINGLIKNETIKVGLSN